MSNNKPNEDDTTFDQEIANGPFLTKGSMFTVSNFNLVMNEDGSMTGNMEIDTELPMCAIWLDIAYRHLTLAEKANKLLLKYHNKQNNEKMGEMLEREFISGLQIVIASAAAIDAHYAALKKRIDIPGEITQAWQRNKTARDKQIFEVIKLSSKLRKKDLDTFPKLLEECFTLRGKAIHPESGSQNHYKHPNVPINVNYHYSLFCLDNTKNIILNCIHVVNTTLAYAKVDKFLELQNYINNLIENITPLLTKLENRYGYFYGSQSALDAIRSKEK